MKMEKTMRHLCCCFTLRTGALIVGWFSILVGCLSLLNGICGFGTDSSEPVSILCMDIVNGCINIAVSSVLLAGIPRRRPWMLVPWIAYMAIECTMGMIVTCIMEAELLENRKQEFHGLNHDHDDGFYVDLAAILWPILAFIWVLELYCLLVVVSYFCEIRHAASELPYNNLPELQQGATIQYSPSDKP